MGASVLDSQVGPVEHGRRSPPAVSKQTRTILLSVIVTLIAVGVLQNMRTVLIRFILWDAGVPLSLFLIFVAGLGFTAGLFWRRR